MAISKAPTDYWIWNFPRIYKAFRSHLWLNFESYCNRYSQTYSDSLNWWSGAVKAAIDSLKVRRDQFLISLAQGSDPKNHWCLWSLSLCLQTVSTLCLSFYFARSDIGFACLLTMSFFWFFALEVPLAFPFALEFFSDCRFFENPSIYPLIGEKYLHNHFWPNNYYKKDSTRYSDSLPRNSSWV